MPCGAFAASSHPIHLLLLAHYCLKSSHGPGPTSHGESTPWGQVWGQNRFMDLKGKDMEWGLIFASVLFHPGREKAQRVMIRV